MLPPAPYLPWLLAAALLLTGCLQAATTPDAPSAATATDTTVENTFPWLAAEVEIRATGPDLQATLTPLRTLTAEPPLGARAVVDAMGYLAGPLACYDCLKVLRVARPDPERVAVMFGLSHPFSASSGRWDLHLFDVRGHLAGSQSSWAFPGTMIDLGGPAPEAARAELIPLENPDGYTSFVDGVVVPALGLPRTQVNLRPYKLFWEDFSNGNWSTSNPGGFASLTAPRGRNVFPVGGTMADPRGQTTYTFHFPDGIPATVRFLLTLDVSYTMVRPTADPLSSRYLLPYGNQLAAIRMAPTIVSNELQAGDPQSQAVVEIRVTDWQTLGDALENPLEWDFATALLDEIPRDSEPQNLRFEAPGLLTSPIVRTRVSRDGGTGTPTDPFLWRQTIRNELAAPEGTYYLLMVARDSMAAYPNEFPWVVERSGRTLSPWKDFATYQVVPLQVTTPTNLSPLAELVADRTEIQTGESVQFCPGPGTFDPDGTIVLWEYDYDFNPADPGSFTPEDTRTAADPDQCVDHIFTTFGTPNQIIYTVGMRVTDDGTPPRQGFAWTRITVNP
ncbi:MAG: hypothetical protein GEEBNDBF_01556 [bacterium]|nr:hypothetical protein [bacterium]